ncbi:MAG TPA: CPBP family intramembrane glutamic endopeptidase [Bryobacteraceae bacterium]|nr:CPBP family intramembrane glutamic endopeptidase [Bryobacteraceae bacterium]
MHTLVLLLFLAVILGLLSPAAQKRLRGILQSHPPLLFAWSAGLALLFAVLAAAEGAFSLPLAFLLLAYTTAPALAAFVQGPQAGSRPAWLDFAAILMLWLPLEFSAGQHLIPRPAQGFLHSVAYGIAILLGLVIFLGFRGLPGMKYRLPGGRDVALGAAGFALTAPVLIAVGRWIGFIPPFHAPAHPQPARLATTFAAIFAGTALPEEILFRSLIQNWLMQRYGFTLPVLLVAGLIFGAAHLDNGPQALPNWRYMILATIAGVAYGRVFQKSASVFSAVTFHALVDATKHFFF